VVITFKCSTCKKETPLIELGSTNIYKHKRLLRCKPCTHKLNYFLSTNEKAQEELTRKDFDEAYKFFVGKVRTNVENKSKKI